MAPLRGASAGAAGVGVAVAPAWRRLGAFVVGKRTQGNAQRLRRRGVAVTEAPLPFCTSDQLPAYAEALLAPSATSTTSPSSWVERDHLSWRAHHRRLPRTTLAFSKALPWLEQPWWLAVAASHVGVPHPSLRQGLPAPEPTRGSGSLRPWRSVTPARAAGMTDQGWTTAALLGYRIPATVLENLADLEHVFPAPDSVHHVN